MRDLRTSGAAWTDRQVRVHRRRGIRMLARLWSALTSHRLLTQCMFLCLSLTACGEDTVTRGSITLRQIVAVVCDDPEVRPGEDMQVTTLVVDPTPSPAEQDYAIIACTTYTGVTGCLEELEVLEEDDVDPDTGDVTLDEEDYREVITNIVRRGTVSPAGLVSIFSDTITIPVNYTLLLTDYGYTQVDASLFVLMCDQGICPLFDEIDAFLGNQPWALSGPEMLRYLSDPELITAGAPLEGVALGRKNYKVSLKSDRNRNHNPTFTQVDGTDCLRLFEPMTPGEPLACTLSSGLDSSALEIYALDENNGTQTQEAVVVRYYTTAGTVSPYNVQVYPSSLLQQSTLLSLDTHQAMPSSIAAFAVAVDSRGGMGVRGVLLPELTAITLPPP